VTGVSGRTFRGDVLVPGMAQGQATVLDEPLSFWGGVDSSTGVIVDRRHPQVGSSLQGRVLLMPSGRGSSSSSSVLAEAIRAGAAPAAILLLRPDPIVALGAMVGSELYGASLPVLVMGEEDYRCIQTGCLVSARADERRAEVHLEED
jgi:predicted aconitase with swiveling domain